MSLICMFYNQSQCRHSIRTICSWVCSSPTNVNPFIWLLSGSIYKKLLLATLFVFLKTFCLESDLLVPPHFALKVFFTWTCVSAVLQSQIRSIPVPSGHNMDPAEAASPQGSLQIVESVHHHETRLASSTKIHRATEDKDIQREILTTQLIRVIEPFFASESCAKSSSEPSAASSSVLTTSSILAPEPLMGALECYAGDPENCNPFLTNCSILFAIQPHTFASEKTRVAYTINHLTGRARLWGTAEWERKTPACASFQAFAAELRRVFGESSKGPYSMGGLLKLRQGVSLWQTMP